MDKIIQKIASVSSELDKKGKTDTSNKLDKLASNILKIVTAQYVGVQGYWIRNTRCWANCYRQKRAKNKDMPAQVVWSECQNEYVESINNDKSGWEKYAGSTNTSLKKIASIKNASEIIENEKDYFNKQLFNKTEKQNIPVGVAVFDTIDERHNAFKKAIVDNSIKLLKIAEQISTDGDSGLAKELSTTAENLVKESQFNNPGGWSGIKDWFRTKGLVGNRGYNKAILERLNNVIRESENVMGLYGVASRTKDPNTIKELNQAYGKFLGDLRQDARFFTGTGIGVKVPQAKNVIETVNTMLSQPWKESFKSLPKLMSGVRAWWGTLQNPNTQRATPVTQQDVVSQALGAVPANALPGAGVANLATNKPGQTGSIANISAVSSPAVSTPGETAALPFDMKSFDVSKLDDNTLQQLVAKVGPEVAKRKTEKDKIAAEKDRQEGLASQELGAGQRFSAPGLQPSIQQVAKVYNSSKIIKG